MPNGLALAISILILALVISYVISMLLSFFLSTTPTPRKELRPLAKKMKLKKGDVFADLGCGDGRVVFEVAKRYKDVKCIGYEISPIHLMLANLSKTLLYPFTKRVVIYPEDFTKADLRDITVVYTNWGRNISKNQKEFLKRIKKEKRIRIVSAE
ncbi:class I SAM-dependent methyltransferase [bacterium]|nr:class I SAM-dependent methyltransferase [bacterium]